MFAKKVSLVFMFLGVALAVGGCVGAEGAEEGVSIDAAAYFPPPDHPSLAHVRAAMDREGGRFTIVALGDSNTEVNWTTRGHLNWVGLLSAGLFESGYAGRYRVINSGVSGDTATEALERLDRDVLAYDPDLVIIAFGTNDVYKVSVDETEASVRELILRIHEAGESSILVRTVQPNFTDDGGFEVNEKMNAMNDAVRRVAESEGVALLDHYALWLAPGQENPPSYYRYDALHPNEFGHLRFYAEMAPVLKLKPKLRWEH